MQTVRGRGDKTWFVQFELWSYFEDTAHTGLNMKHSLIPTLFLCLLSNIAIAQIPIEDDYFPLDRFTIPEGIVLEAGAIEPLPDGTLAVATRRGDIYRVTNAWD